MPGTPRGGANAAKTNKRKYGADFYHRIGAMGGKFGKAQGAIKGFAANPELASRAGKKGGTISRKGNLPKGVWHETEATADHRDVTDRRG